MKKPGGVAIKVGKTMAIVDSSFQHLSQYTWRLHPMGYAITQTTRHAPGGRKFVLMHHCVVGRPIVKMDVDHINGNRLDNRVCNLRIISHRENVANQKRKRDGKCSSRYTGVRWNKCHQRWMASACLNGKTSSHIGTFKTEKEAADAYKKAVENQS